MKSVKEQLAFINRYSDLLDPSGVKDLFLVALAGAIYREMGFLVGIGPDYISYDYLGIKLPLVYDLKEIEGHLEDYLKQYGMSLEQARPYCRLYYFMKGVHACHGKYISSGWRLGQAVFVLQYCRSGTFETLGRNCHPWIRAGKYDYDKTRFTINYHGIRLSVKKNYEVELQFQSKQQRKRFAELLNTCEKVKKMKRAVRS